MITSDGAPPAELRPALVEMLLAAADDDLFIGHADSEWTGLAPMLEEDIAFSSIAQDEIAHAREWYTLAAGLLNASADDLAYGRPAEAYRCAALTVRPDEFDFSLLVARQFYYDHFDTLRLMRWSDARYRPIADVARRIVAEEVFHLHHADDWIRRLARGGPDGRQRIQSALDRLWPDAVALFEEPPGMDRLVAAGWCRPAGACLFGEYWQVVHVAVTEAGLRMPTGEPDPARLPAGGRRGSHPPQMRAVLDELAEVYRVEPQARW